GGNCVGCLPDHGAGRRWNPDEHRAGRGPGSGGHGHGHAPRGRSRTPRLPRGPHASPGGGHALNPELGHAGVTGPSSVVNSLVPRAAGIETRRVALKILQQVREGRPFEAALDRNVGELMEADRRLAHELAAGVLRQRSSLDSQLAPLVPRGWSSVAPELQDILRLGAYQLTGLDRVPAHAAVDTSVELAKENGGAKPGAFVNAVLRRLARAEPSATSPAAGGAERLAVEYSHPVWLVHRWVELFGLGATERLLRWNNTRPRLVLQ